MEKCFLRNSALQVWGGEFIEYDSSHALISLPENFEIFHAEKVDAFKTMLCLAYPDYWIDYGGDADSCQDLGNDYLYKISGQNAEENGFYLFCVTFNKMARGLGAKVAEVVTEVDGTTSWVTIQQPIVSEIVVPVAYINNIVRQLTDYDLSTRLR